MEQVSLIVNGLSISEELPENTLLVDFLRDTLRLTGTHVGCDTSQCGACNVQVNGKVVKACTILTLEADGAEIITIEGMSKKDGSLTIIQKAFQDNHGLQCGYCTPGMIMTAAELLRKNDNPSEFEIREYLEGNICRCTGYHNIVKSIQVAAKNLKINN
ncbi:MAG: (2Fe-2S)-binding protein [Pseudomonadota bacterium]|nr:(2Fe-2S)-binding protein [Pseudomonadota bacterium]